MVEFELIDETFDINITQQYHISIQVSLNGYCFSVLDLRRNKYILLKNYIFPDDASADQVSGQLLSLHEKDEFLQRDYQSVYVMFVSERSTLVPLPLFEGDKGVHYFNFNHGLESSEQVRYNKLRQTDAVNLFTVNRDFERVFSERFSNAKFFHQVTPFIEKTLMDHKNSKDAFRVFLNVHREFFDIITIHHGRLELSNSFRYKTESDFTFFILYVLDQLKINPGEAEVTICGELSKDASHTQLLKTFVKDVSFEKYSTQSLYSYTLANIAAHRFFNLFNLYHCG
jgi:hypothetical protein